MRALPLVAILCFLLPAPAFARAPRAEDVPTIRGILEWADRVEEANRKAAAAAARDDKMDRIRAYGTAEKGKPALDDYKYLTDVIRDDREETKYRQTACDSIRQRFKDLPLGDEKINRIRRSIGREIVSQLGDNRDEVRLWVYGVFKVLFPKETKLITYDPREGNFMKRNRAVVEWRKFLSK